MVPLHPALLKVGVFPKLATFSPMRAAMSIIRMPVGFVMFIMFNDIKVSSNDKTVSIYEGVPYSTKLRNKLFNAATRCKMAAHQRDFVYFYPYKPISRSLFFYKGF